jgi:S-adenosylmethionine hydrolase
MPGPPIALLTDFGLDDWYVGVMKGVILTVNPEARIVDVTHGIPRHDVLAASFALLVSYPYLPRGTIFIVVVDPGVGTARRILCTRTAGRYFIAPDNGILTGLVSRVSPDKMVSVENQEYFLRPLSSTFHGRDIFAPVAARLSQGVSIDEFGPRIREFHKVEVPGPAVETASATATVVWVDSFGNLITNCRGGVVEDLAGRWGRVVVQAGSQPPFPVVAGYETVEPGLPLGIIGSSGYLEISIREASAEMRFGLGLGAEVHLLPG